MKTLKTYSEFIGESAVEKRTLARTIKRKLSDDFTFGGTMNLIAMADEDVMSIQDAAKAISTIQGVGKFTEGKLSGGMKASYGEGMISIVVSSGKIRIEFS